jgi:hypothetical protein
MTLVSAGSTAERKLDVGFMNNPKANEDSRCHWSQILIPEELKSNPAKDKLSTTWRDLGRYESLHTLACMLQRDVSIGNLMMNEEDDNPSWRSFLIDLDLAIKEQREAVSGARGKTGTRAFMAIGVLLGEKHSFMHDLDSWSRSFECFLDMHSLQWAE